MKIRYAYLFILTSLIAMSGCQKYNQIDNSSTVKTPYVLYIGGYNGTLHKTNDALYFNTLFPTDNSTVRQVLAADSMLLYMKQNFYHSKDEGRDFKVSNVGATIPFYDLFYKYYLPNTALFDKIEKKVYLCTNTDSLSLTGTELKMSTDLGQNFNDEVTGIKPNSITQLDNNDLFVIEDTTVARKIGTGPWTIIPSDTAHLPSDTALWYVAHASDTLFAIDYRGRDGVYYSIDFARNWIKCIGVPKKHKILFGHKAQGSAFYIGIDSGGLYRLNGNTFASTSAGIPWYAKVSFVESKRVVYRTDRERNYLFCATDQGLFISETNGLDWKLLKTGSYSTLY